MKKNYIIALVALLATSWFIFENQDTTSNKRKKILSVSSEEMKQQRIEMKVERRKNGYVKKDKPDKFVNYYKHRTTKDGKSGYAENYKITELKSAFKRSAKLKSATATLPWVQRGPGNVGGRTRTIIVDPTDVTHKTWFAGAVSGGVWKTTDAGSTWEIISPDLPNLAIVSLAMAPSNPNVIYAGTGEGYYNVDAVRGQGIFKSTDKGETWNQLTFTTHPWYHYINSIVVSPTNESLIWVCTNKIVTKSTDGGTNWSDITPSVAGQGRYQKLILHPTNENILWVTLNGNGIYKTENGGTDWTLVKDMSDVKRIELAIAPSNPDALYALDNNSVLYFSKDGGSTWAKGVETGTPTEFLGGQGWYNNTLAIDPTSENKGFIGGIDLYSFILGQEIADSGVDGSPNDRQLGATKLTVWSAGVSATNYSHADHHHITIDETLGTPFGIIVGNDGGVGFSDDGGDEWTTKSNGYITSQFYGVGRHPDEYKYFGGLQDNGSQLSGANPNKMSDWTEVLGGDGFDVVWHPRKGNKLIGTVYYNSLYRSDDGGIYWSDISGSIGDNNDETAPFITEVAHSKTDPDVLFVGGVSGLWKSIDFGTTWNNIDMGVDWGYGDYASPKIAISEANPQIVWAGNYMNDNSAYTLGKVQVSTDGGATFTSVNNPMDLGAISNIVTHPNDPETAYVLFSFSYYPKIFRTTDLGQTWEDISGFNLSEPATSSNGFPNVAVNTLLVMPFDNNEIWVGTEIGLFISYDNGANWTYANNGIPAVSIWDMKIVGDEVVLGTHGLGVWSVQRNGLSNVNKNPYLGEVGINPQGNYPVVTQLDMSYDSLEFYNGETLQFTIRENVVSGERTDLFYKEMIGSSDEVSVSAYINGERYFSNTKTIPSLQLLEAVSSYTNNFSERFDDFVGEGFSITKGTFSNYAIQTPHPYAQNSIFYYHLKYPVVVADDINMAFVQYKDIAFVETGEPGAEYPSTDFYDYVVVEASEDGINWINLEPGYDFSYNASWANNGRTYKSTPDETLYVDHNINLRDYFSAKDTVLIRFKLYSDPYETGWGWAIDNLYIQGEPSSIFNTKDIEFDMILSPNPASGYFNLTVDDPFVGDIEVSIYDLSGRMILKQSYFKGMGHFVQNIQIPDLKNGNYIVTVKMNGDMSSKVLVVRK
ncbi:T9SS type A sorting domain-containing protein [Labilibacter sediminis]|nr:T9SS type A sorting domain-containing protein [Labilibacter sediminis]